MDLIYERGFSSTLVDWTNENVAVSTFTTVTPGMLLWHTQMTEICGHGRADYACAFWVGSWQLHPTASFVPPHGMHIHIQAELRSPDRVQLSRPASIPTFSVEDQEFSDSASHL